MARKAAGPKKIEALTHEDASRMNIPTAEYQSLMATDDRNPVEVAYERCNRDIDPQLVWRGKDPKDWSDLVVQAPPLFIQEKVHPKALVDDLMTHGNGQRDQDHPDLFADFNGLPDDNARTEFYRHDANWTNRMILGDGLQVMASLAEREGLRGKVQCIYIDPPYGIKFNSNFQWSTTSRDVKDGKADHITREPEQVKAFRDTWRDGIHSYLTYLRDRTTVALDLLTESGSIFVQIGEKNVHRVRILIDEIFGENNFVSMIPFIKTSGKNAKNLDTVNDYIIWYAKDINELKYRQIYYSRTNKMLANAYTWIKEDDGSIRRLTSSEIRGEKIIKGSRFASHSIISQSGGESVKFPVEMRGKNYLPSKNTYWKTNEYGMHRLSMADRLFPIKNTLTYKRYAKDFPVVPITNWWDDTIQSTFAMNKIYVVETYSKIIERCILMTTDPGDLVLDPTCGSGTTAYVAEQWGRRWITIDTSRVALALARARIMGARYPYYLLADSPEGRKKEAEISRKPPSELPTHGNIRQGFVYERVPHITLRSIANNAEIDVIWEKYQEKLEPLRRKLNQTTRKDREEWEIPREPDEAWSETATELHREWWERRIARQREIDASIAAKADYEYLYDKPFSDSNTVRVAGPFTVESVSPHRVLALDEDDEPIDLQRKVRGVAGKGTDFAETIVEQLRTAGVQQAHKEDRIAFTELTRWPGKMVCAEGRYAQGEQERHAAIFVGPEFGTVSRPDLVEAAREAADARFNVLIACAFNYDAHASEFDSIGRIPVLKARMNADLHMAEDLKNTGKGNLFVVFGEPEIDILPADGERIKVRINGVDVFHPNSGEVQSHDTDGIACWFIDTDYDQESFFVRHAYFPGANDPYKALKTTLKAEIDKDAWDTLNSDVSRPFDRPASGRIAVKVINHLGDEVMKVFRV